MSISGIAAYLIQARWYTVAGVLQLNAKLVGGDCRIETMGNYCRVVVANLGQDLLIGTEYSEVPDDGRHHSLGMLHDDIFHGMIPVGIKYEFDGLDLPCFRPL